MIVGGAIIKYEFGRVVLRLFNLIMEKVYGCHIENSTGETRDTSILPAKLLE